MSLEPRSVGIFVGRQLELAELASALHSTMAGRGRLVLLALPIPGSPTNIVNRPRPDIASSRADLS